MDPKKLIALSVVLVAGFIAATADSFAAKPDKCSPWPACKDDGGEPPPPPPPPPPTGCVDSFPGFLYEVEATRKAPAELHLASSDGCRSELIAIVRDFRGSAFHMTADGSKGVILWSEDIENQYIVRRLDFTVNNSGVLALGQPVTVLPLAGEEALPGDFLFLRSIDIWGDAAHDSLYLTIRQRHVFNSGPNAGTGTRVALIYDLNDLTDSNALPDVREIYNEDAGGWQDATGLDCSSLPYPQFVPTCYGLQGLRFNPSGTRLYMGDDNFDTPDGQRWSAALRIRIDMGGGLPLAKWTLTGPELVFAGPESSGTPNQWAMTARPSNDPSQLPETEYIAAGGDFLNADQCATDYAFYASGNSEAPFDLWLACVDTTVFAAGTGGNSWQTPEALLGHGRATSHHHTWQNNIYRIYVSGALAGTNQLLIENGRDPDTGL